LNEADCPRTHRKSLFSTIKIPFAKEEHAVIARRAIQVDRELNAHLVERKMEVEGSILIV